MSITKKSIGFNAMKIAGDAGDHASGDAAARREFQHVSLGEKEVERISVVSPLAESDLEMAAPYRSPVTSRYLAFDVVVQLRRPDQKEVRQQSNDRIARETVAMSRSNYRWKMSPERKAEIRDEVREQLALASPVTVTRDYVVVDYERSIAITSARRGEAMDRVISVTSTVLGSKCSIHPNLYASGYLSSKKRILPLGISENQTSPPRSEAQWMEEFLTWMAARSLSGEGLEPSDVMRTSHRGGSGKSMSIRSRDEDGSEVSRFCLDALSSGGLVKEFSFFLHGGGQDDRPSDVRVKMSSSGYVAGMAAPREGKAPSVRLIASIQLACDVACRLGQMASNFLSLRQSGSTWGDESAKLRLVIDRRVKALLDKP